MSLSSAHRPFALIASIFATAVVCAADDPLPPLARLRIGATRLRHSGEIVALAYSPDGRIIATAGRDDTISLWNRADGKGLAHFHAPSCVALSFARDGKSLLWCDGRGHLYRCDAGQRGEELAGQREGLHRFAIGAKEGIEAAAFAVDGSVLAVGARDDRVLLWGRNIEVKGRGGIQGLALSPNGRLLAANRGSEGVSLFAIDKKQAGHALRSFGTDTVRSLAFAPDSTVLAVGDYENRIRLWDANTGRELRMLEGHRHVPITGRNGVFCLAFSPSGAMLASGGADGTVRLWDVKSGGEIARCTGHGGRVRALAFAPDGKTVASAGADHVLRLWDAATGREVGPIKDQGGAIRSMSVSADGRTLALVRMPGRLTLWDVTTGKANVQARQLPAPAGAAAFAADGRTLAAASLAGHLQFWDLAKAEEVRPTQNVQIAIRMLAVSKDGKTAAFSDGGRRILVWDAEAGQELRRLQAQGNTTSGLFFSPDGQALISAGPAGVRLWTIRGTEPDREMAGKVAGLMCLDISPDGRMVASGGQDGTVRLWELSSGQQRRMMFGDSAYVRTVAFAPGGKLLASGGENGTVRLWDAPTGQRLHIFVGHRGGVAALAFADRGSLLVTGGQDGTVLVWSVRDLLEAGRTQAMQLPDRQLQALWHDLASDDASRAYEAVLALTQAPAQALALLRQHLRPISADRLARLLEDLDSDEFKVRDRAMKELAAMGKAAEPALRILLKSRPSLEARRRAETLLEMLKDGMPVRGHLRILRAVEVLETIGTEPARKLLQYLAEGAADVPLTREAKAALARLSAVRPEKSERRP